MENPLQKTAGSAPPSSGNSVLEERHMEITRGKPPDEWDTLLIGEEAPESLNMEELDAFFEDLSSLDNDGATAPTEKIAPAKSL